mmetsp:Transcript_34301/g.77542  ORF Transcript_34301/g.77542 Transcript_34301/m.77542 type:complete len:680 (-) Transcript_34301:423-2462(-)
MFSSTSTRSFIRSSYVLFAARALAIASSRLRCPLGMLLYASCCRARSWVILVCTYLAVFPTLIGTSASGPKFSKVNLVALSAASAFLASASATRRSHSVMACAHLSSLSLARPTASCLAWWSRVISMSSDSTFCISAARPDTVFSNSRRSASLALTEASSAALAARASAISLSALAASSRKAAARSSHSVVSTAVSACSSLSSCWNCATPRSSLDRACRSCSSRRPAASASRVFSWALRLASSSLRVASWNELFASASSRIVSSSCSLESTPKMGRTPPPPVITLFPLFTLMVPPVTSTHRFTFLTNLKFPLLPVRHFSWASSKLLTSTQVSMRVASMMALKAISLSTCTTSRTVTAADSGRCRGLEPGLPYRGANLRTWIGWSPTQRSWRSRPIRSCWSRIEEQAKVRINGPCPSTAETATPHCLAPSSRILTKEPKGPTGLCSKRDSFWMALRMSGTLAPNWVAGTSCCLRRWATSWSMCRTWAWAACFIWATSRCSSWLWSLALSRPPKTWRIFSASASLLSRVCLALSSCAAFFRSSSPEFVRASCLASLICASSCLRSRSASALRRRARSNSRLAACTGFFAAATSLFRRSTFRCASSESFFSRSRSANCSSGVLASSRSFWAFATAASRSSSFLMTSSCLAVCSSSSPSLASTSTQKRSHVVFWMSSSILSTS